MYIKTDMARRFDIYIYIYMDNDRRTHNRQEVRLTHQGRISVCPDASPEELVSVLP